jgi:hypothetical protein
MAEFAWNNLFNSGAASVRHCGLRVGVVDLLVATDTRLTSGRALRCAGLDNAGKEGNGSEQAPKTRHGEEVRRKRGKSKCAGQACSILALLWRKRVGVRSCVSSIHCRRWSYSGRERTNVNLSLSLRKGRSKKR